MNPCILSIKIEIVLLLILLKLQIPNFLRLLARIQLNGFKYRRPKNIIDMILSDLNLKNEMRIQSEVLN